MRSQLAKKRQNECGNGEPKLHGRRLRSGRAFGKSVRRYHDSSLLLNLNRRAAMNSHSLEEVEQTRQRFRQQMPIAGKWAYFDHAAVAPITAPADEAMRRQIQQALEEGDTAWPEWARKLRETREAAADLIGASPDEIALMPNTTAGINLVAEGLDWRAGDNV